MLKENALFLPQSLPDGWRGETVSKDYLKDEYLDVSHHLRHYAKARFATLTLFLALVAGLLAVLFGGQTELAPPHKAVLKLGGLLTAFLFLVIARRASRYWQLFKQRAIELEQALGFKPYTQSPRGEGMNATLRVEILYVCIGLFWLSSLFFQW
jgi:hypothetical protein